MYNYINTITFFHFCRPYNLWICIQQFDLKAFLESIDGCLKNFSSAPLFLPSLLYIFSVSFLHQLSAVDDSEFLQDDVTLLSSHLTSILSLLKNVLYTLFWTSSNISLTPSSLRSSALWDPDSDLFASSSSSSLCFFLWSIQSVLTKLFQALYIRNQRLHFIPAAKENQFFVFDSTQSLDLRLKESSSVTDDSLLGTGVELVHRYVKASLLCIPQVVSFHQRVALFQTLLANDKSRYQNEFNTFRTVSLKVIIDQLHIFKVSYSSLGAKVFDTF